MNIQLPVVKFSMLVLLVVSKDANDDHVPHPPTQASSSEDDLAVLFINDLGTGDPQERHGEEDSPTIRSRADGTRAKRMTMLIV